jgi:hypothetical protein
MGAEFLLVSIELGGNIHDFVRQESHEYIAALNCLLLHVEQSGCQRLYHLRAGGVPLLCDRSGGH